MRRALAQIIGKLSARGISGIEVCRVEPASVFDKFPAIFGQQGSVQKSGLGVGAVKNCQCGNWSAERAVQPGEKTALRGYACACIGIVQNRKLSDKGLVIGATLNR